MVSEISNHNWHRPWREKQNKPKQTNQIKQTRGVDMHTKVFTSVECVLKQVSVVLCDCDPLGGVLLICSLCGGKIEHTQVAQLENR